MKRARVEVFADRTIKTYEDPELAAIEADWYRRFPWACPSLLDFDGLKLTIKTHPVAESAAGWRPVGALRELILSLHGQGVHHRDVHVKNIVKGPGGKPLLIDWETAIEKRSAVSYDLYGPEESTIPIPLIHARLIPMWWGSRQRLSIKNQWEVGR